MTTSLAPPDAKRGDDVAAAQGPDNASELFQVVSFRLANVHYGINILTVQEIILMGESTTIPGVPDYVKGLINLRGNVIPVIDLRLRFGVAAAEPDEHTRIIVTNALGKTLGLMVDAAYEVLRINTNEIEPLTTGLTTIDATYITGVVKLESRLLILLDADAVISEEKRVLIENQLDHATRGDTSKNSSD